MPFAYINFCWACVAGVILCSLLLVIVFLRVALYPRHSSLSMLHAENGGPGRRNHVTIARLQHSGWKTLHRGATSVPSVCVSIETCFASTAIQLLAVARPSAIFRLEVSVYQLSTRDVTHVISHTSPSPFQRATLKNWVGPADEACLNMWCSFQRGPTIKGYSCDCGCVIAGCFTKVQTLQKSNSTPTSW